MIKVGIIGAAGYTAGELLRILIHHPEVEIAYAQSESQAGKKVYITHTDLVGETELAFTDTITHEGVDVVFLCKGHGESAKIIDQYPELLSIKIVDLSQDFRLKGDHDFIYGLPEKNKAQIQKAQHIANPGCFATSIQLGMFPSATEQLMQGDVHISGITGSTGAGQSLSKTSHFSWRNSNASVYKAFKHQHLLEIGETVLDVHPNYGGAFQFIPYRGAFTRGIITTSYFDTDKSDGELKSVYQKAYTDHPFTHLVEENPDLKMVVNSNKCIVFPSVIDGKAMVISIIDNLLKGASGQAVQNMNLIFGLDEKAGLNLKSSSF